MEQQQQQEKKTMRCFCDDRNIKPKVSKKGFEYYTCSKCSFKAFPGDRFSKIKCGCERPCVIRTVKKEGPTKGKDFICCNDNDKGCKFFEWV